MAMLKTIRCLRGAQVPLKEGAWNRHIVSGAERRRCYGSTPDEEGPYGGDVLRRNSALKTEKANPYRSLCKLTLIGRTGTVPEIREFDNGDRTMYVSVATNHARGDDGNGNRVVETQWHKVVVPGTTPGFSFLSELPVGTQVYVEGNLRIRTVEDDTGTRQYVNVVLSRGEGMIRVLSSPWRQEVDTSSSDLPF